MEPLLLPATGNTAPDARVPPHLRMNAKTVLIADDSPVVLKALENKLVAAGYRVVTAHEPSEAIEKARFERPDAVIVDINFPAEIISGRTWDGYRLVEWIRQTGILGAAPVLIITSEDIDHQVDKAVAAGATGVFQKPINARALLDTIEENLQRVPQNR